MMDKGRVAILIFLIYLSTEGLLYLVLSKQSEGVYIGIGIVLLALYFFYFVINYRGSEKSNIIKSKSQLLSIVIDNNSKQIAKCIQDCLLSLGVPKERFSFELVCDFNSSDIVEKINSISKDYSIFSLFICSSSYNDDSFSRTNGFLYYILSDYFYAISLSPHQFDDCKYASAGLITFCYEDVETLVGEILAFFNIKYTADFKLQVRNFVQSC